MMFFTNNSHRARHFAGTNGPNIIPVHDVGTTAENKSPFYTMKLIEGESLLEVIQKLKDQDPVYEKKYTLYNRLNIFRKICATQNTAAQVTIRKGTQ